MEKVPSSRTTARIVVPTAVTSAPATGSRVSASVTVPEMMRAWPKAPAVAKHSKSPSNTPILDFISALLLWIGQLVGPAARPGPQRARAPN